MPLEQSESFVLRTFNIGEQDKLVVFLSGDKGIFKGVAKGARKFGNRFGSSLEPMSLVKVFYYEKERRELVTVNSCDLIESFFEIQKDMKANFTLSYFTELIEGFFPSRSKDDIIFRLLHSSLKALKDGADIHFVSAYFEAWILKISGILPHLDHCKKCLKVIKESGWLSSRKDGVYCSSCTPQKKDEIKEDLCDFLRWIKKNPPSEQKGIPYSVEELECIRKALQSLIIYHMEKEPKSLRYLK
jgi:DNA repair protein RecO (recombination protein O)